VYVKNWVVVIVGGAVGFGFDHGKLKKLMDVSGWVGVCVLLKATESSSLSLKR